jgi:hypothetical protein
VEDKGTFTGEHDVHVSLKRGAYIRPTGLGILKIRARGFYQDCRARSGEKFVTGEGEPSCGTGGNGSFRPLCIEQMCRAQPIAIDCRPATIRYAGEQESHAITPLILVSVIA